VVKPGSIAGERLSTHEVLTHISSALSTDPAQFNVMKPWIDRLVQRFEVSKRLYEFYVFRGNLFRADSHTPFRRLSLYLEFAEVAVRAYQLSGELPYLNVLLKALDTPSGVSVQLADSEQSRLAWLIVQERALVKALANKLQVRYET